MCKKAPRSLLKHLEGFIRMKIMFIGDITAKIGRRVVGKLLPKLRDKYDLDFVIANAENATHGKGLIFNHYELLLDAGIDAITLGNHYDDKNEIRQYIDGAPEILRPYNLKEDYPGVGTALFVSEEGIRVRVTSLLLEAFMNIDVFNPFFAFEKLLNEESASDIHIVDIHGETTAEKLAFGFEFDGRVSAIVGTHTHVQTRDYRILENGTAYITDVGMSGPYNGILGVDKEKVIARMKGERGPFTYDNSDDAIFNAVIIEIDDESGKATNIFPIY